MKNFIIILILLFSTSGFCTEYYVTKGGSDSNGGLNAVDDAWLTIQKAADNMVSGDTVTVSAGTYAERITYETTLSSRVTFKINGSDQVIMNGFYINNNGLVTVDGFEITGTPTLVYNGAMQIGVSADSTIIENCNIHDMPTENIYGINFKLSGGLTKDHAAATCIIRNNIIKDIFAHAMRIFGDSHLVYGNTIDYPKENDGMRVFGHGHIISDNFFYNVTHENGSHSDLIQTFSDNCWDSQYIIFERNYADSTNQGAPAVIQFDAGDGCEGYLAGYWTFRNNIFVGIAEHVSFDIPNTSWYNNLFFKTTRNTGHPIVVTADAFNATIKNNIFIGCGNTPDGENDGWYNIAKNPSGFVADYNHVTKETAYGSRSGFSETNGINGGDPKFVSDVATLDFHLQSDSPDRNTAEDLSAIFTDDYDKVARSAWDIGPLEYGDATPPTATTKTISANGTTLTVVYDEAVTQGSGYNDSDIDVNASVTGNDLAVTYVSGDGTTTHVYTVASTIQGSEAVTIDFNGDTDSLEDASGNDLAAIVAGAVTNNSTQGGISSQSVSISLSGASIN